jgi:hypothetical protein
MFKKAVFYIYYRLWDMHSRGEDQFTGAILAIFTTSLFFWLNIFSVIVLLRKLDLIPIFFSKTVSLSFMILLFVVDYFLFVHNKKYEKIIQMFKDEPKNERRKKGLLVVLYILLLVVAFVLISLYKPGKI